MLNTSCYAASEPCGDKESLSVLFENIDVLLKNIKSAISAPENYYIQIQGTGITGVYIGFFPLYLGDLLQLWSCKSAWLEKSESGTKYIYHLGGFPTSGQCWLKMYNTKTCRFESEERGSFIKYFADAHPLIGGGKTQFGLFPPPQSKIKIARLAGFKNQSNKTLKELIAEIK
ncbi:MAG: hypothetical protein IKO42_02570 [Opitutales bacterium]|nr:hypothetical protein [Opitutales bacterium]